MNTDVVCTPNSDIITNAQPLAVVRGIPPQWGIFSPTSEIKTCDFTCCNCVNGYNVTIM